MLVPSFTKNKPKVVKLYTARRYVRSDLFLETICKTDGRAPFAFADAGCAGLYSVATAAACICSRRVAAIVVIENG